MHLQLKPDMMVADIACGPGRVTIPLSKKLRSPGKVVAIDLQQNMLDRIKSKTTDFKSIELRNQNVNKEAIEENFYDRILLVNVLREIPNQEKAILNIFAALKKDGVVSITETIFDPYFQSKKNVTKMLTKHTFINIKTFGPWYSYTVHGTKE